ncbi:MAG: hypothetical protein LBS92_06875 [Candidatus Methanoplasma sp.]|jgi:uncharacterized protein YwgA|nr:hypothetical protein [Candidatus Methanoplasma sp.]
MTSAKKKKEACPCHEWTKEERELPDGFRYHYLQCNGCYRVEYPLAQAQRLMEYAKTHQFMFVSDWILAWMYVGDGVPISGITALQKQLFIILNEFAVENNIVSENPGFRAYKFGPYTETIDSQLEALAVIGLVHSEGRLNTSAERFCLTENGMVSGKKAFEKLTPEQRDKLRDLRHDLQQFTVQGIMTYVYSHYPKYTEKSAVFERTLHRRRC